MDTAKEHGEVNITATALVVDGERAATAGSGILMVVRLIEEH